MVLVLLVEELTVCWNKVVMRAAGSRAASRSVPLSSRARDIPLMIFERQAQFNGLSVLSLMAPPTVEDMRIRR